MLDVLPCIVIVWCVDLQVHLMQLLRQVGAALAAAQAAHLQLAAQARLNLSPQIPFHRLAAP